MARELLAKIAVVGPDASATLAVMNVFFPLAPPRGKPFWNDRDNDRRLRGWEWFDFLPPNGPVVSGFTVRIELVTCPAPQISELVAEAHAVLYVPAPTDADDAIRRVIDASRGAK